MATLFDQPPRNHCSVLMGDVESTLEHLERIATKRKVSLSEVLTLHRSLVLDRANDLRVRDEDAKDEQLAGFASILRDLVSALEANLPSDM